MSPSDKLLLFSEATLTEELLEVRGHRAIGVVYHPEREHLGNYVPTVLPKRYDALLYIDETRALHPLGTTMARGGVMADTYPFAL